MAESKKVFCEPCEHQDVIKPAKIWCNNCEEGFCDECVKSHNQIKALRKHHLISVEDHLTASNFSVSETCSEHEKKYLLFCVQHDSILCPNCFQSKHKICEVVDLDEAARGSKTSTAIEAFDKEVTDLLLQLSDMIKVQDKNKGSLLSQDKVIRSQIKDIRTKLDQRLDKLQDNLLSVLKEKIGEHTTEVENGKENLQTKIQKFNRISKGIRSLKEFASEKQTFISIRQNMELLRKEKEFADAEMSSLKSIDMSLAVNDGVLSTLNQTETLGTIRIQKSSIAYSADSKSQAQIDIPHSIDIKDLKPKLKQSIQIGNRNKEMCLTSCVLMPNNKMVFVDNNGKRLIVHNKDNSHRLDVAMPSFPFDATAKENNKIAVTMPDYSSIAIVNIDTGSKERNLINDELKSCCGISCAKEGIYVVENSFEGVLLIDINGTVLRRFSVNSTEMYNISIHKDKLFALSLDPSVLYAYDETGKQIWGFEDLRFHRQKGFKNNYSTSLTTDNFGNIFVVCPDSNLIMIVSNDGQSSRVFLEASDNLVTPSGVSYLPGTNQLLVCNAMNGCAAIYDLQN